jgi:AcrR family transcriptional regulator
MIDDDHPTRAQIAAAATRLFATGGYGGVSLRAIAAEAGVQLSLIPYHFGSKAGLYRAIWASWMGRVPAAALLKRRALPQSASLNARVGAVVAAFFDGPRSLLLEKGGADFVAIMVREAHDPSAVGRGLLDKFIRPNGRKIVAELAGLLPKLHPLEFTVGRQMMVSALRIVIEQDRQPRSGLSDVAEVDRLFSILVDYVTRGWLGLAAQSATAKVAKTAATLGSIRRYSNSQRGQ